MNWLDILSSPWPYITTAALAVIIGWYVWKQPLRPGTRYFRWLVVIWFVWSIVAALYNLIPSPEIRYVLWVAQGVFPLVGPPLVLMIVLEYTGNEKWLAYRRLYLLFIPALLILVISFFPNTFSSSENFAGNQVFRGTDLVRWGFYAYFLAVMLVTLVILFARFLRAPAFWAPIWLLIFGRIIPILGYPLSNTQPLSVPPVQSGLLYLGITMGLYFIALYSFQILQVSPVARDAVIAHMPYSLLVLDAKNRLVDFNQATSLLPMIQNKLTLHKPVDEQLPVWWKKLEDLLGNEPVSRDIVITETKNEQIYRVTSIPLKQTSGWRMGQAFLLEDVTQARHAEQLQTQTQRAMATLQEREHLARELHDELAQELALINIQAQLAKELLAQGQAEKAQDQLQILANEALRAQVDVREEISKLLQRIAEGEDFQGALDRLIHKFQESYGIKVQFIFPEGQTDLDFEPSTEVQLLRIIQEVLTNVRKHAQATEVKIKLDHSQNSTQLLIEDNGIGFDVENLPNGKQSYGLGIISERAKEFHGSVTVDSTPGNGTKIVVSIPVNGNSKI